MPTVPESVMVAFLRAARYKRIWADSTLAAAHLADRTVRPKSYAPPRRLRDVVLTVERYRGWPLYTLAPTGASPRGTVIYAHGGGWVNEIAPQHWQLCARIAAQAQTTVLVPIYPLIPEGTAAEVVDGVTELAAARAREAGPLVLAGDSAGGQIALSAAEVLRDRHGLTAAQTILISPALDPSLANPEIAAVEPTDPWLGRPGVRVFAERWRGDLPLEDPRVSPIFGELGGLGPITLFVGTRDIVFPDSRRFAGLARSAGVEIDYHERLGLVHVYPLLPTAEGGQARWLIVDAVRSAVGQAAAGRAGATA